MRPKGTFSIMMMLVRFMVLDFYRVESIYLAGWSRDIDWSDQQGGVWFSRDYSYLLYCGYLYEIQ
jgi:hypothetical protein